MYFYPRPPRGGRLKQSVSDRDKQLFLSTPSARRATFHGLADILKTIYFYPRPPRGGRPRFKSLTKSEVQISIHALREEGDGGKIFGVALNKAISIHALREEGDSKNGEKHLRFCFIIKRSAQIWKSLSKNIRKNSCDLHRTA